MKSESHFDLSHAPGLVGDELDPIAPGPCATRRGHDLAMRLAHIDGGHLSRPVKDGLAVDLAVHDAGCGRRGIAVRHVDAHVHDASREVRIPGCVGVGIQRVYGRVHTRARRVLPQVFNDAQPRRGAELATPDEDVTDVGVSEPGSLSVATWHQSPTKVSL